MPVRAPALDATVTRSATVADAGSGDPALRRVLLWIVGLGSIGLIIELLLLGHFEEWRQWLPLVVLGLGLGGCALLALRPRIALVQAFRWLMVATVVTGVVGIWLHFAGNRAFEIEMDAAQGGWLLAWHSLRGATPALAPGAMVQLGLTGLLYTWRHPALAQTAGTKREA